MAAEQASRPNSPRRPLPGRSKRRSLGSLATGTADAINDIGHLLNAYRCVENLLMPTTHEEEPPQVTNGQLHALMSTLNDALAQRIRRAGRMARHVQQRAPLECASARAS